VRVIGERVVEGRARRTAFEANWGKGEAEIEVRRKTRGERTTREEAQTWGRSGIHKLRVEAGEHLLASSRVCLLFLQFLGRKSAIEPRVKE